MHNQERPSVDRKTSEPIQVLHVGDDETFRALVQECFEGDDDSVTVRTETDPTRVLTHLEHGTGVDAVICEYRVGGIDSDELLRDIRRHDETLPVVTLTERGDESVASESIHAGVMDYVVNGEAGDHLERVVDRVREAVLDRRATAETERFDTLIQMLEVPILAVDVGGEVISTNGRFERSFRPDDDGTLNVADLVVAEERETVRCYLETLQRDTGPDVIAVELTLQPENGPTETYRTRMAAVPGIGGAAESVLIVVEPLTEEPRFEATITDLVEWAAGPYVSVDASWEIILVNDAATTLFGRAKESLIGRALWDVLPAFEDASFHDQLRSVVETGVPLDVETFYAPIQTYFHVRAYPTNKGVAIYLHDITSRVAHTQKLEQQSNRLRDFVGAVSHDLRNPLTVAGGQVDLLELAGTGDAETLKTLRNSLVRAEQIIDQALAFAEEGRVGPSVPVTLSDSAGRSWDTVVTNGATCNIESNATIFADPDALGRILENLFRNSVEHGSTDSRPVTVRIGDLPSTETTVGFYVEDDGPGIPEEQRIELFQTDFSTHKAGAGFGLAIVDQISAAHGWNVAVTEGTSGGARFEFTGVSPFLGERRPG